MEEIKVRKDELLAKLKTNLDAHVSEFTIAHAAWVEETILAHKSRIKSLRETGTNVGAVGFGTEPTSQAKSYERAIAMLEMSVDNEIVLSMHEFDQYVLDNWTWTQQFKTLSANYTVGSKRA